MRRFFAADLTRPDLVLDRERSHHLLRVVGIAPGEQVELYDGVGGSAVATLIGVEKHCAALHIEEVMQHRPPPQLWLLMGCVRGPAMETAVRMGTELGMTHFVPVLTARVARATDRRDRLLRVAQSAIAQCGRADQVAIFEAQPLMAAVAEVPAELHRMVATFGPTRAAPGLPAALVVGPEGGLTEGELGALVEAGFQTMGLGPTVLRSETAAVAAMAQLNLSTTA